MTVIGFQDNWIGPEYDPDTRCQGIPMKMDMNSKMRLPRHRFHRRDHHTSWNCCKTHQTWRRQRRRGPKWSDWNKPKCCFNPGPLELLLLPPPPKRFLLPRSLRSNRRRRYGSSKPRRGNPETKFCSGLAGRQCGDYQSSELSGLYISLLTVAPRFWVGNEALGNVNRRALLVVFFGCLSPHSVSLSVSLWSEISFTGTEDDTESSSMVHPKNG